MISIPDLLVFSHLLGLSFGLGAATVKFAILLKSNADTEFLTAYLKVTKIVTRFIVIGILILILSGIGWLIYGYQLSPLLIAKIVMVVLMLVLGPVIDNIVEPKLIKNAPKPGEAKTPEFIRVQKKHLVLEVMATALMYAITVLGVLL